jgi:hypothetical protein
MCKDLQSFGSFKCIIRIFQNVEFKWRREEAIVAYFTVLPTISLELLRNNPKAHFIIDDFRIGTGTKNLHNTNLKRSSSYLTVAFF